MARAGADVPPELEVIDRYQYMLRHVEAVLLRNLDVLYGTEQAAAVFAAAKMKRRRSRSCAWPRFRARSCARECP